MKSMVFWVMGYKTVVWRLRNVSEEYIISIFRAEQYAKEETNRNRQ
jgi:hypothetical protein